MRTELELNVEILRERVSDIGGKLDKLIAFIIPAIEDVSKHLAEAKELANKGKFPRKQPKKKFKLNPSDFPELDD